MRRNRRRSVLLWCIAVVSLLAAASSAGAVAGYGDVADGRYYTEAVQWSADNDIAGIDGNCFAPDAVVTRGEASVYMWNMQNQPTAPAHGFDDIADEGQNAAVSWMFDNEITTGTSPTTFSPDTALTRAHLVTFLWRLAGQPPAPAHSFNDVHAGWQQSSVAWAADREITTGTSPTTFAPDTALTRAHLVTFLYRYQNKPDVTIDPASPQCDTLKDGEAGAPGAGAPGAGAPGAGAPEADAPGADAPGADAPGVGSFKTVSAGSSHSCGVGTDSTVTCWGGNWGGKADAPGGEFKTVSADGRHSCGVRTDSTVTCWGDNDHGQADAPEGEFTTVSAGGTYSCGVRTDSTVTCWGSIWDSREFGQAVPPEGEFKTVSAGSSHSCGVKTDNTVTCWGANWNGQADAPDGEFTTVSADGHLRQAHSCGVRTDSTVTCWGSNREGQADAPETDAPETDAPETDAPGADDGSTGDAGDGGTGDGGTGDGDTDTGGGDTGDGGTVQPAGFVDVDPDGIHAADIVALAAAGIATACSETPLRYCPDSPVTKAQMASFFVRALALPAAGSAGFTDVDPDGIHAADINAIHAANITVGCSLSPLRYCPDSPVMRAQMASFFVRALALPPAGSAGFIDVDPHSAHAADINAIYAAGIATACSETPLRYCPDSDITRAQMASFLVGALNLA